MALPHSVVQRAFAAGEIAPALHLRADLIKYVTGLRTCRNFMVQRHGGVTNRPGTRFVQAAKTTSATVMLLRYVSEIAGQSMLLELGNGYIRFFQNGAALQVNPGTIPAWNVAVNYVQGDLVKNGGVNYYARADNVGVATSTTATWYALTGNTYELPSPFGADLPHWVQSGRVITLTHRLHQPVDLVFVGLTTWLLKPVSTANAVPAPVGVTVTPGGGAGTRTYGYVVTAGLALTYEESPASAQVINASIVAPTPGAPHVVHWTAVAGAVEYYVYCDPFGNGTYGYIGTATGATTFNDSGVTPDFTLTPPVSPVLFNTTDNYPDVCCYFEQRRFFGYTNTNPDGMFGSRTGLVSNFGLSSPLQADDAVTFRIAGNNHNPVRHLLSLKSLIVLTDAGEWTVNGGQQGQPIEPTAISAQQQTYVGASDARPVIVGNAILYVQARGSVLRDLQFDLQVEGLGGKDLSIFSAHLFDGLTVTEIDYAQTPDSIVWAVRSDGVLLGLTYIREQDVWGWHRHDTGAAGAFEHVCVVPELTEDVVYVLVKRTIGGVTKRYVERLANRQIASFNLDAFFVDAGLTYSGVPVTNITGLDHLNGQVVAVIGDGVVIFDGDPAAANAANFTVAGGTLPVALPVARSIIHAGLPIRFAEIELLDLDVQGQAIRDKRKRVGSVTLQLDRSARTFRAGPDSASLVQYALGPNEPAATEFTGAAELNLTSAFNDNGRVFIRHTDPLPLTILGVMPNVELGG